MLIFRRVHNGNKTRMELMGIYHFGGSMFKGYNEYRGVLVKKNRTIWGRYVFKINDGKKIISVKVGKALFDYYQLKSEITIVCKGKKLINIRSGIVFD